MSRAGQRSFDNIELSRRGSTIAHGLLGVTPLQQSCVWYIMFECTQRRKPHREHHRPAAALAGSRGYLAEASSFERTQRRKSHCEHHRPAAALAGTSSRGCLAEASSFERTQRRGPHCEHHRPTTALAQAGSRGYLAVAGISGSNQCPVQLHECPWRRAALLEDNAAGGSS